MAHAGDGGPGGRAALAAAASAAAPQRHPHATQHPMGGVLEEGCHVVHLPPPVDDVEVTVATDEPTKGAVEADLARIESRPEGPLRRYLDKMRGGIDTPAPFPTLQDAAVSWLGAFLGILLLSVTDFFLWRDHGFHVLVASFGASAVLLFGVPESKLSQPRNLVGGQIVSAVVGVCVRLALDRVQWLANAVGMSLALLAMQLTRTTHPPGGATALIACSMAALPPWHGFQLVLAVALGCAELLAVTLLVSNLHKGRAYPTFWCMRGAAHDGGAPLTPAVWVVLWISLSAGYVIGCCEALNIVRLMSPHFMSFFFATGEVGVDEVVALTDQRAAAAAAPWCVGVVYDRAAWFAAVATAASVVGALAAAWTSCAYGRRASCWVGTCLVVAGAALQAAAWHVPQLATGVVLVGVGTGGMWQAVLLEDVEIAPVHQRGLFTSIQQLGFFSGFMLIVGLHLYAPLSSIHNAWRLLMVAGSWPAVAMLLLLPWMHETPSSLIQRGKLVEGQEALRALRGELYPHVHQDSMDIWVAAGRPTREHTARGLRLHWVVRQWRLLWRREQAPPLLVVGLVTLFIWFADSTWKSPSGPIVMHAVFGPRLYVVREVVFCAATLAAAVAGSLLVDRVGRRPLLLASALAGAVSCGGMSLLLGLAASPASSTALRVLVVVLNTLRLAAAGLAWPVWLCLAAENFTLPVRSAAVALMLALGLCAQCATLALSGEIWCATRLASWQQKQLSSSPAQQQLNSAIHSYKEKQLAKGAPADKPAAVSPHFKRGLALAGIVASSAAYVTGKLAALVGKASYATAIAIARSLPGHGKARKAEGELVSAEERSVLHTVGAAGLVAFVDVYDALEAAAGVVLAQSAEATQQYMAYKYGAEAGEAAAASVPVAQDMLAATMNFSRLGARAFVSKTAKKTASAYLKSTVAGVPLEQQAAGARHPATLAAQAPPGAQAAPAPPGPARAGPSSSNLLASPYPAGTAAAAVATAAAAAPS
ncbi:hypothetical protein HT031_001107 [Scenedesmus sp. PABB004]|nr:hypothetical protein HT031_001107 [Scenedesmus sp. PABB004]